jgi:hypothetical protein
MEIHERGPSEKEPGALGLGLVHRVCLGRLRLCRVTESEKKADVGEHPEVFPHVGLLVNEPPGTAGLPFI